MNVLGYDEDWRWWPDTLISLRAGRRRRVLSLCAVLRGGCPTRRDSQAETPDIRQDKDHTASSVVQD